MSDNHGKTQKSKKADARKVIGVTPKFYIKDEGTDYTTGEEYNGLWSAGTIAAPTGYADCGTWKFLERQGTTAFNHRTQSKNPLSLSKIIWGLDLSSDNISFKLIDNEPISVSPDTYIMLGSGGAYTETKATNWISYLQSPGLDQCYPAAGTWPTSFCIDMWVYCRKAPSVNNQRQTFFHAVNKAGNTGITNLHSHDSIMPGTCIQWDVSNRSGTLAMNFTWPINTGGATGSAGQQTIWSSSAANALWPKFATDPTADGGLHHIAVVFDATSIQGGGSNQPGQIQFATPGMPTAKPDAFWIDGEKYLADDHTNGCWWGNAVDGTPNTPESDPIQVDTNAFIGCELTATSTAWDQTQINVNPGIINHFLGKIYQATITINTIYAGMSVARIKKLFALRFDIPRGPAIVDFSERYEYDGKNLLQEIGSLKQTIESNKGTFQMSINSIKVKN
jgi:hypothetical protein